MYFGNIKKNPLYSAVPVNRNWEEGVKERERGEKIDSKKHTKKHGSMLLGLHLEAAAGILPVFLNLDPRG